MTYEGRSYEFEVPGLEVFECRKCGEQLFNIEADHKISGAFRGELGLLQPEQIREGRKKLGLSQKELALYLSATEESISRWETGALIQSRIVDRQIRLYFASPVVRKLLKEAAGAPAFGTEVRFEEELEAGSACEEPTAIHQTYRAKLRELALSHLAQRHLANLGADWQVAHGMQPHWETVPPEVDSLLTVVARYAASAPPDELRRFHAWLDPRLGGWIPPAGDHRFVSFLMDTGPIDRLTQPLSRFGRSLEDVPTEKVGRLINDFQRIVSLFRGRDMEQEQADEVPER